MEWTPAEIERLRQLTESKPLPGIAEELGRNKEQVRHMIRKLGLKTRAPGVRTPEQVEEIIRFADENGVKAAADRYGMTQNAVSCMRRRIQTIQAVNQQIQETSIDWSMEEIARLSELCKTHTRKEIALHMGRPLDRVIYMLRKYGLKTPSRVKYDNTTASRIIKYSKNHGCDAAAEKYKLKPSTVSQLRNRVETRKQKQVERLDPEEMLKLRKMAIGYACKLGYNQDAEDFASYVTIQALHKEQVNFKWALSEYRRTTYGNHNSGSGREKLKARFYKEIDENPDFDDAHHGVQVGETPTDKLEVIRALNGIRLKERERVMFVLSLQFGLRGVEIALAFGLSPARVEQILNKTIEKVAARERKRDREAS